MFPEILHVFYGILTFFCITFDALQMRLIVTDVVVTLTIFFHSNEIAVRPTVLSVLYRVDSTAVGFSAVPS